MQAPNQVVTFIQTRGLYEKNTHLAVFMTENADISLFSEFSLSYKNIDFLNFLLEFQQKKSNGFGMCAVWQLWQYGLWSFQTGGTKLERFLPKNQHTQRKLLNFEN